MINLDDIIENLPQKYIDAWVKMLKPDRKWVLFSNGTCVIYKEKYKDLEVEAREFLKLNGPVIIGTPLADFDVAELAENMGWIVYSHTDSIMTIVLHEEIDEKNINAVYVGLYGRFKRDRDAQELEILFVNK